MILKMILKSFDFQCDFDFQITTSKMILILNHLYLGDVILILKSSTYDDFAHLCAYMQGSFSHSPNDDVGDASSSFRGSTSSCYYIASKTIWDANWEQIVYF